jgi:hypothetical protein
MISKASFHINMRSKLVNVLVLRNFANHQAIAGWRAGFVFNNIRPSHRLDYTHDRWTARFLANRATQKRLNLDSDE